VGIGFAISSHSAARGRFENGSHCCMWSDQRSKDAGYHHAVSTRRPEKLNRILVLVNSRAVGRSENPGVPVVIRWSQSVPPGWNRVN
jgi:hypothetical protein